MGLLPLRECARIGCRTLIRGRRYCDAHAADLHAARVHGEWHRLYNDQRWRAASRAFLNDHPLCSECGGAASVTDHITPHRGDERLFWLSENWQPLCKRCHDRKTAQGG